jgi:hypothetical protein
VRRLFGESGQRQRLRAGGGWLADCVHRSHRRRQSGLLALARLNPGPVEDAAALRHALSQSLDDDAIGKNMYQSPLRSANTSMDHWLK